MAKNNQVGNKKPNVFRRFGNFLGKSASELKKVTWPSFATVVKNTGIVLAVVIFFTLIIGAADFGLSAALKALTGVSEKSVGNERKQGSQVVYSAHLCGI